MRDPIVIVQDLLPQRWLARTFGRLARSQRPWLKNRLIRFWIRTFDVSLEDAACTSVEDFATFEEFFARELKPGSRPQPANVRAISAPAEGFLHAFDTVDDGRLLQAKGIDYPLAALLGNEVVAKRFCDGWYATIYLSPADYHRIHAPCDATLTATTEIPGLGYSVTRRTERVLPDLYCRNERLVSEFETVCGPMVLVMVGAMLVSGIEMVWRPRSAFEEFRRSEHGITFRRGDELGRFTLGSTVILLFTQDAIEPQRDLRYEQRIRIGDTLGLMPVQ